MKNISINGAKQKEILEKEIDLRNGSLVLQKVNGVIVNVFMVVSFRDNKNQYSGDPTAKYCTLLNLDNGVYAFEERCSRKTTVRRVLNHLLRIDYCSYEYNNTIPTQEYGGNDIEVLRPGYYKLDVIF